VLSADFLVQNKSRPNFGEKIKRLSGIGYRARKCVMYVSGELELLSAKILTLQGPTAVFGQ